MWAYRDWVINAFNRNMPFDQFTIEQLAGDLLPEPRRSTSRSPRASTAATSRPTRAGRSPRNTSSSTPATAPRPTSQVWLGLTAGCAVCHDHKFDPLTPEGVLLAGGVLQQHDPGGDGRQHQGHAADRLRPAAAKTATAGTRSAGELAEATQTGRGPQAGRPRRVRQWLASPPADAVGTLPRGRPDPALDEGPDRRASRSTASRDGRLGDAAWSQGTSPRSAQGQPSDARDRRRRRLREGPGVLLRGLGQAAQAERASGAIFARMDDQHDYRGWDLWVERRQGRHPHHPQVAGRRPQGRLPTSRSSRTSGHHVFVTYDGSGKAAGVKIYVDGQPQDDRRSRPTRLKDTIRTKVPLKLGQRHTGSRLDELLDPGPADLPPALSPPPRSSSSPRPPARPALVAQARRPADRGREGRAVRLVARRRTTSRTRSSPRRLAALEQEEAAIKARATIAHVMQEKTEPPMAYVLFRGEYDKRRDPVQADTPAALPPMPADLPRNRLGLAQWLLRPEHPLTARVTVNRFWQEVFGTGHRPHGGRLRRHRRAALPSRAARLAGGRVPRVGLGREAVLQAAGHLGRPTGSRPRRRPRSSRRTRRTGCSRAGRGSGWTPRWSATTPWPPAACWSRRSAGRASGRTSPKGSGRRWR